MPDPSARFILTAEDRTAAAFRSADRGLRQLQRSVAGTRSLLAGFGVVFSGRAFASWISGALKAAEATGAHAEQIKTAQDALAAMKKSSDELALSIGVQLTPAFQGLGNVLQGLNTLFFNADAAPLEQDIKNIEESIREMKKHGIDTGIGELLYSKEDQARIAELNRQLDQLKQKQREALGLEMGASFRQNVAIRNSLAGMKRIGDFADRHAGAKRPTFEVEWLQDLDALEEIVVEARQMSEDELLKPFPTAEVRKLFEPMKAESLHAAEFVGESFKDALTGWLIDGEFKFKDFLRRMAIELAASQLFNFLGSAFPAGSFLGKFFGGSRASGGSVRAGMMYRVHEGEGFFTPGKDGHVGKTGSGTSIGSIHVDARGATDPAAVEAAVERGVLAAVSIADERTNAKFRAIGRPVIA